MHIAKCVCLLLLLLQLMWTFYSKFDARWPYWFLISYNNNNKLLARYKSVCLFNNNLMQSFTAYFRLRKSACADQSVRSGPASSTLCVLYYNQRTKVIQHPQNFANSTIGNMHDCKKHWRIYTSCNRGPYGTKQTGEHRYSSETAVSRAKAHDFWCCYIVHIHFIHTQAPHAFSIECECECEWADAISLIKVCNKLKLVDTFRTSKAKILWQILTIR